MPPVKALLFASAAASGALAAVAALVPIRAAAQNSPVYEIVDGKVDQHVWNGYRRYADSCMRCHGPDGAGSSYAPNLTESLHKLSYEQFQDVIINGRQNVNATNNNVMPSFGLVEDVVLNLDDIYGYLKARSDGILPRGRPPRMDRPSQG